MEHENCNCHKTKERSPEEYKCLIHRLNRIEGQIRGIRGMVEKSVARDVREGRQETLDELVATIQKLMK